MQLYSSQEATVKSLLKHLQGSTNLIFACSDFGACKVFPCAFVHTELRVHKTVTEGTNLQGLIYNLLIVIIVSIYFVISLL